MATPLLLYLLNEAASGTTPTTANDTSTGTAANLAITFQSGDGWATIGGGRGVQFFGSFASNLAKTGSLSGTKVQTAITGKTAACLELVATTTANSQGLIDLDDAGNNHCFSTYIDSGPTDIAVKAGDGQYNFTVAAGLHHWMFAFNSGQPAGSRIKLAVDGSPVSPSSIANEVTSGIAIDVNMDWSTSYLQINDRDSFFAGETYFWFAALYASDITGTAAAHSAALLANNDADPNGAAAVFQPFARRSMMWLWDEPPAVAQRRVMRAQSGPSPTVMPAWRPKPQGVWDPDSELPWRAASRPSVIQAPAPTASFVPFRRAQMPPAAEPYFLWMGARSAIAGAVVTPDNTPSILARRILEATAWAAWEILPAAITARLPATIQPVAQVILAPAGVARRITDAVIRGLWEPLQVAYQARPLAQVAPAAPGIPAFPSGPGQRVNLGTIMLMWESGAPSQWIRWAGAFVPPPPVPPAPPPVITTTAFDWRADYAAIIGQMFRQGTVSDNFKI